jgi:glycosyltransferase involved in cell wall biosynthesis
MEGGVQNAMAEAICSGCVIATTKISAYLDATGNNEYGLDTDIDDENGFSDILLKLATNCDLSEMSMKAYKTGCSVFNMESIVGDIYGKLCDKGL